MCDRLLLGPPVCICNGKRGGRQWAGSLSFLLHPPTAVQTPQSPEKRKSTTKTLISHIHTTKNAFQSFASRIFLAPVLRFLCIKKRKKEPFNTCYLIYKSRATAPPIPSIPHQNLFCSFPLQREEKISAFAPLPLSAPAWPHPPPSFYTYTARAFPSFLLSVFNRAKNKGRKRRMEKDIDFLCSTESDLPIFFLLPPSSSTIFLFLLPFLPLGQIGRKEKGGKRRVVGCLKRKGTRSVA